VSLHAVVLAWLRAERKTRLAKRLSAAAPDFLLAVDRLLDESDLYDPGQNRIRLRLLYVIRLSLFVELPPDICWFRVQNLTDDNLIELRAINDAAWNDPDDKNELLKVAARKQIELEKSPVDWETPILFGHHRGGPFTIIEGNTRLVSYSASNTNGINIPIYIGLSRLKCVWHILDDTTVLMQDLIAAAHSVVDNVE
jgi:hypothetical protein